MKVDSQPLRNAENRRTAHPLYYVGTLVYSRAGLAWLFIWLLWGDFCFTMMETVVPSILPLRLKELQAPDWVIGMMLVTIPGILNVLVNPIVSTMSDRYRGPRGRRIPFMLYTVPFVALALCLMAFSTEFGAWLYESLGSATGWNQAAVAVFAISLAMGLFKLSDLFVGTVFWYFFKDVVPETVLARFLGLFRVVGAGASMIYNYFIFQYALSHMRMIFLSVACLYFVGFSLMCLMVKEGQYPPAEKMANKRGGILNLVKNYLKECLSHRIYIYFFLYNMFWSVSAACGIFNVFRDLSLGLTLQQIGTIAAAVGAANLLLTYPAGALADRYHPLCMMIWIKIAMVLVAPLNFIWLFTRFGPEVNFRILIVIQVINLPLALIFTAVNLPLYMRILPSERFGQFCSFNAICQAGATALAGIAAGYFIGTIRHLFPDAIWGEGYCYRMIPAWALAFMIPGLVSLILLYRTWKILGGKDAYIPP